MSETFRQIGSFLGQYVPEIVLFTTGALGASQRPSILDGSLTREQRVFAVLMGGVTSVLLTHLVAFAIHSIFKIDLSVNLYPAVGYFLGHWGLHQVSDLMVKLSERKTNNKNNNEKK